MANRVNPRFQVQNFLDDFLAMLMPHNAAKASPNLRMLNPTGVAMPKRRFTPTESALAKTRQSFTGVTSPSSVVKGGDRSHVNFNQAVLGVPGARKKLEETLKRIMSPASRKEFLRKWEEAIDFHVPDGTY